MSRPSSWAVELNGVVIAGGNKSHLSPFSLGELTEPPSGLGLPGLRTEDVTYLQRDGVRQFSDWYTNRILTFSVSICDDVEDEYGDECEGCNSRVAVQQILKAWDRACDTEELTLWTDCSREPYCPGDPGPVPDWWQGEEEYNEYRAIHGPYVIRGRPRVADVTWERGDSGCATLTLRFDALDHLMFVTGCDGTPDGVETCVEIDPTTETMCRAYPRCYDSGPGGNARCYDQQGGNPGSGPVDVEVYGTECVCMTVTFTGVLTAPTIENVTSGATLTYNGVIADGETVTVNTCEGTATLNTGDDRTGLLVGDARMVLDTGVSTLRLTSTGGDDDGQARVCFPWAVVSS